MRAPVPSGARRFAGKVAVVTGAGGGIGSAGARRLAAEGADVVCDVAEAAAAASRVGRRRRRRRLGSRVRPDRPGGLRRGDRPVVAERDRVDVLVNNAGVNRRGDLLSLTDADWELTFAVNVNAIVHLCWAVLPHMIAAGGAAIVNTASQWGLHPVPGHIADNVSRAAVVSFTQNLARDHALHGVRVNAVAPGEIYKPMVATNLDAPDGPAPTWTPSYRSAGSANRPRSPRSWRSWPRPRRRTCAGRSWRSPARRRRAEP